MSNFTLKEWRDTQKEDFTVPEDVKATINELQEALYSVCKANDVPYLSLTIDGCDPERGYEVSASQNLPLTSTSTRVPAELLVVSAIADQGIEKGMMIATELFLNGQN